MFNVYVLLMVKVKVLKVKRYGIFLVEKNRNRYFPYL